jgi:hypothetical protein
LTVNENEGGLLVSQDLARPPTSPLPPLWPYQSLLPLYDPTDKDVLASYLINCDPLRESVLKAADPRITLEELAASLEEPIDTVHKKTPSCLFIFVMKRHL